MRHLLSAWHVPCAVPSSPHDEGDTEAFSTAAPTRRMKRQLVGGKGRRRLGRGSGPLGSRATVFPPSFLPPYRGASEARPRAWTLPGWTGEGWQPLEVSVLGKGQCPHWGTTGVAERPLLLLFLRISFLPASLLGSIWSRASGRLSSSCLLPV